MLVHTSGIFVLSVTVKFYRWFRSYVLAVAVLPLLGIGGAKLYQ